MCIRDRYDTFAISPNEAGNYHLRYPAMVDNCVAHYCYEVVTGAGISDASVSWFWTGAMDGPAPLFPCSSDGYQPAGFSACDESIKPPSSVPVCTSPDPYLSVSPPSLAVEQCPGQVSAQPMRVCNLGAEPLTWSLGEGAETDWLSEDLASGTLEMLECQDLSVTFDATKLPPGTYSAELHFDSNDPTSPRVTVPGSLVVPEPVHDVSFSWEPSNPYAGNRMVFRAAAQGVEPISYAWDFQEGTASSGAVVSQLYATPGEYLVTLTATNACGQESAQRTVTVVTGPVLELEPPALSPRQCGGAQTEQTLRVCNAGSVPLTWSLGEWPTFSSSGGRQRSEQMAQSPATRQAGEQLGIRAGSRQLPTWQVPAPPGPSASLLEAGAVVGGEAVGVRRIEIEHAELAAGEGERNDDLAGGGGIAGDVTGELGHVGDDDGGPPCGGGAADTAAAGDAHAGGFALERPEDQLAAAPEVEAGPVEIWQAQV